MAVMTVRSNLTIREKPSVFSFMHNIVVYIVLSLWACTTIIPLIWVLLNSFKTSDEILTSAISIPEKFSFFNYQALSAYSDINMFRGFINSFIISGGVVLGVCLVAGFASFALGRFKFKLSKLVKTFLVATMLVPQFAIILPNFLLIRTMHIQGTYLALIIPQIATNLSFSILMISGFMASLPSELEEAAIIDGCSIPGIFFRITAPLSLPMFATMGIMVFIWSYNNLLMSLVYLSNRRLQPICVLLSLVRNTFGTDYGAMMAAIIITIIPVLILYVISQENVVKGLTAGAVKG